MSRTMEPTLWRAVAQLSRMYQLFCLTYVAIVFRNEATWITNAADSMHVSLGTASLWPTEYQRKLRVVSLSERLAFTTFSLSLVAAVVFILHCSTRFASESRQPLLRSWSASKAASTVLLLALVSGEIPWIPARLHAALHAVDDRNHFAVQAGTLLDLVWWEGWLTAASGVIVILCCVLARRSDPRTIVILSAVARGFGKCTDSAVAGLPTLIFPLAMMLWTNHQGENDRTTFRLAKLVQLAIATHVSYATLSVAVFATMVGVHVIELVLMWLASVLLGVWLPATLVSNIPEAMMGISCGVVGCCVLVGVETTATLRVGLLCLSALAGCSAVVSSLHRFFGVNIATRVAEMFAVPVLIAVFGHLSFLSSHAHQLLDNRWVAWVTICFGLTAQTLCTKHSKSRLYAWAKAMLRVALLAMTAALAHAVTRSLLSDVRSDVRLACAVVLGLGVLGLTVENERIITTHAKRSILGR
jgi:hypothetical protein